MASTKIEGQELRVGSNSYQIAPLKTAEKFGDISRLPRTLKVLLENQVRHYDGSNVTDEDIKALVEWTKTGSATREIAYYPARVLMQDFTGVPAVVDLAAMRDAMADLGDSPAKINPLSPVDLVIDHSVSVDFFGSPDAFKKNVQVEMERNGERYEFLRWGQKAFKNFRVVPPGTGICHQVNVEYLGQTVWTDEVDGKTWAYPDTLVGTDSHTTMINGLAILGWGVGGIEAEAAMLGQPISMLIPEVVGFKIKGQPKEGVTATDVVLTVTEMLRKKGVVGKFVEFYGPGLKSLSIADRSTIANMAPEYGATCGFFPVDEETINFLRFTGRDEDRIALVEAYAKEQGFWREDDEQDAVFSDSLELDLSTVVPSMAGPKRPQDRIPLTEMKTAFQKTMKTEAGREKPNEQPVAGQTYTLNDGHVVIAAITSCTNTSNPAVMLAAGLVAKKANELGMKVKPWVKTSLAPGSPVVTDYLVASGLQQHLDALGFNLVGYGCTTCIGNSGPLAEPIAQAIEKGDLVATSVLSGNRNFEGRISPHVRANFLASPPLVVVYALAGTVINNPFEDAIGEDSAGNSIYLKDVWPTQAEIKSAIQEFVTPEMYKNRYSNIFEGPKEWQDIKVEGSDRYKWSDNSTYIKKPSFFEGMSRKVDPVSDIKAARALAVLGDSITTDHISPAGAIKTDSPAGKYLQEKGVKVSDFNSFGSRRGNHEVMVRGTFGNIRLKNEMADGQQGGWTKYKGEGELVSIYEASMRYQKESTPLVVIAGKEYGTGSSRDWAAKGTDLLGVRAVIAESFERIHRSNLIGMGVLPLEFAAGADRNSLNLVGTETYDLTGLDQALTPKTELSLKINYADGSSKEAKVRVRIDTENEMNYFRNGGILHFVLRRLAGEE